MKTKEKKAIQKSLVEKIDYDELMNCTQCGFCLSSCPTYIETVNDERHSPRGRIALMKGMADGIIEPSDDVKRSIDLCLGCRACEPACPSGVKFGHLLEQTRDAIYQSKDKSILEKTMRNIVFKQLFPKQNRMEHASSLVYYYQKTRLDKGIRSLGILEFLPDTMQGLEKALPKISKKKQSNSTIQTVEKQKTKVAFFRGCLMDTIFKKTNESTIELLEEMGCEVFIPEEQNCCGALHGHSGEMDIAKEMAKNNIIEFENEEVDYIITNAGGCGAFLNDYSYLMSNDSEWAARAEKFSNKIKDISSILVELGFDERELRNEEQVVTYQDSCHLRNVQKTYKEPRQLINAVEGIKYVEMEDAKGCCGSAGIYNILESKMSMQILDKKMENIKETQATTIITANPGCLLQMKLGIEKENLSDKMRAVHIVDFLLESIRFSKENNV